MIAAWMGYATVLAACIGTIALALELVARMLKWPTRWIWLAAMVASVGAPLIARSLSRTAEMPNPASAHALAGPGHPVATGRSLATLYAWEHRVLARAAEMRPDFSAWDRPLTVAWIASSVLLLALVGFEIGRRQRARWDQTVLDGIPVAITNRIGPAVIGILRPIVAIPRWVTTMKHEERALILRHEAEHIAGGDPVLLLASVLALVLSPWNLALWWQYRRFRLAIEMDCDARVVRVSGNVHQYGMLLLRVSANHAVAPLLGATLAARPSALERRIVALCPERPWRSRVRVAAGLLAASAALVAACHTRPPMLAAAPVQHAQSAHAVLPPEIQRILFDSLASANVVIETSPDTLSPAKRRYLQTQLRDLAVAATKGDTAAIERAARAIAAMQLGGNALPADGTVPPSAKAVMTADSITVRENVVFQVRIKSV